jgi:SIT4-associating protein SAP185/190
MGRGYNRSLALDLFESGRITERIMEGQANNDEAEKKSKTRLGYMGHLTLIAEEVVKFTERHPQEILSPTVLAKVMSQDWIYYVEHTLAETRERDNAILGGTRPELGVGSRQAVLNAVSAAQFGNFGPSLSNLAGNGNIALDSTGLSDASNTSAGGSAGGLFFSGSSLLSGFSQGSSDEEDDDMEEQADRRPQNPISESDQVGEISFDDVDMDYR